MLELGTKAPDCELPDQNGEIGIEQNRCAMACQGCGAAFFFSIIK